MGWSGGGGGGGGGGSDITLVPFVPQVGIFPAADAARLVIRNGVPTYAFDDTTQQSATWLGMVSDDYDGADLEVELDVYGETATSGTVEMGVEIAAILSTVSVDSYSFGAQQSTSITISGTLGRPTKVTIALTQAQADQIVAGATFLLRLKRNVDGTDTMLDDAQTPGPVMHKAA